ncbi:MAG: hypothetical protein ACYCXQ_05460 [Candidatus Humimicrobiaceae bacterium]
MAWESSAESTDEISGELSATVTSGELVVIASSEGFGLPVSSVSSLIPVSSVFSDDTSGESLSSVVPVIFIEDYEARAESSSLPVTGNKPQLLQIAAVLNIIIRTRMQITG